MNGKLMLYIDQYGNKWHARTVSELREQIGGGKISKMYIDKADGRTVHIGYIVGQHWCRAYMPVELPA